MDTPATKAEDQAYDALSELDSQYKNLTTAQLAEKAVVVATRQIIASTEFKKPRLARLNKYWELYDGKTPKKLRQLFNVAIPVFPGMIDTLNAQHDTPIQLSFKEGDAADYFSVLKVNGAWQMEVMNTAKNSKWDGKLRMLRKHVIMNGVAIPKYTADSDPEYKSILEVVNLKHFHFQPRGGLENENHLFNGEEDIEKTADELKSGARAGIYDKGQVRLLLSRCADTSYLPEGNHEMGERLSRFKPLGLDPDQHSYVGQAVYKLAQQILEIDGKRYLLVFHPWSRTWLRFERWSEICSSDLYPWTPYATHEDSENLLSKSFADDLYPAADAIVAMFNQELTGRERRNVPSVGYDKDMVTDPRKLDEALTIPGRMVALDTKGGTRRIAEAFYEFKTGELNGTVNLIDWINGTLGRNVGATDLAQGSVEEVSKKASVTFAEQKSVSKRIGWQSQPFQDMMAQLGKRYIYGLKDHMPSKMAIRLMGENGWDWDEITRLDLDTTKDVDVLIVSTDQQVQDSEMKAQKRKDALLALAQSPNINSKKRDEEILRSVGGYEDQEIAEFLDVATYSDKKSIAKASEAIQLILRGKQPELWYGATIAFMQKIVDYANDKRSTLGEKFDALIDYSTAHTDIVRDNLERKVAEDARLATAQQMQVGAATQPAEETAGQKEGMSGGMARAMNIAEMAV
jgi:hypothetical protein